MWVSSADLSVLYGQNIWASHLVGKFNIIPSAFNSWPPSTAESNEIFQQYIFHTKKWHLEHFELLLQIQIADVSNSVVLHILLVKNG